MPKEFAYFKYGDDLGGDDLGAGDAERSKGMMEVGATLVDRLGGTLYARGLARLRDRVLLTSLTPRDILSNPGLVDEL